MLQVELFFECWNDENAPARGEAGKEAHRNARRAL